MAKQIAQLTVTYFYEANSPEEHIAKFGKEDRGGYHDPVTMADAVQIEQFLLDTNGISLQDFLDANACIGTQPSFKIELLPEWFSEIFQRPTAA